MDLNRVAGRTAAIMYIRQSCYHSSDFSDGHSRKEPSETSMLTVAAHGYAAQKLGLHRSIHGTFDANREARRDDADVMTRCL
jgi:hypothetical protein